MEDILQEAIFGSCISVPLRMPGTSGTKPLSDCQLRGPKLPENLFRISFPDQTIRILDEGEF